MTQFDDLNLFSRLVIISCRNFSVGTYFLVLVYHFPVSEFRMRLRRVTPLCRPSFITQSALERRLSHRCPPAPRSVPCPPRKSMHPPHLLSLCNFLSSSIRWTGMDDVRKMFSDSSGVPRRFGSTAGEGPQDVKSQFDPLRESQQSESRSPRVGLRPKLRIESQDRPRPLSPKLE